MKRLIRGVAASLLLIGAASITLFLYIASSLPQLDGTIIVSGPSAPIQLERDHRGLVAIKAHRLDDAYFGLGFAHAQDRLSQMQWMRRFGSGRLAEILGERALTTDKFTRLIGFRRLAEAQWKEASTELRQALLAYSAGVNAFLDQRKGALPLDLLLAGEKPNLEKWHPIDSLLWGRIMAWQLSSNYYEEKRNEKLAKILPPEIFSILAAAPPKGASNNWVLSGERSLSGKPLLANDPHLSLNAPSPWYLVHLKTPSAERLGASAPGLPFLLIGTNGKVAWGFTTTASDTEDLFEEIPAKDSASFYFTPDGLRPFSTWTETFRVKEEIRQFTFRKSRHGPILSDLENPSGPPLALSWSGFASSDRTAEALMKMNQAENAEKFKNALQDFHTPQQNVVYADHDGTIGFLAAGRVPIRKNIFAESLVPAPGNSNLYDWQGWIPFPKLPQSENEKYYATANNKIVDDSYPFFLAAKWENTYRIQRIFELLEKRPQFDLAAMADIQRDILSPAAREFVPRLIPLADPAIASLLSQWDYRMTEDSPQAAIFTVWLREWARELLVDQMGSEFKNWFFWQMDDLKRVAAFCNCPDRMKIALARAVGVLSKEMGNDPSAWRWGNIHRLSFSHPILGKIPLLSKILTKDLETPGDNFTLNRAAPDPGNLADIHGPTLRFLIDMATPLSAQFAVAGGQSDNPLSPYYSNLLGSWQKGQYLTMLEPSEHTLTLEPEK